MSIRTPFAPQGRSSASRGHFGGSPPPDPPPPPPPGGPGAPVISSFTALPLSPVTGQGMTFNVTVSEGSVTLATVDTDGDGNADFTIIPGVDYTAYAYPAAGTFTPTVTVSGPAGEDTASTNPLIVTTAPPPQMQVLNKQTYKIAASNPTISNSYVVPSGNNKVLVLNHMNEATSGNTSATSVVFREDATGINHPMTKAVDKLQADSTVAYVSQWFLVNPPEVSGQFRVTTAATPIRSILVAVTLTNCTQAPPVVTVGHGEALNTISTELDTTGFPYAMVFGAMAGNNPVSPALGNAPPAVLLDSVNFLVSAPSTGMSGGASYQNAEAEATYTDSWSIDSGGKIAHIMAAYQRVGGAAAPPPPPPPDPADPPEILRFDILNALGSNTVTVGETVSGIVQDAGEVTLTTIDWDGVGGDAAETVTLNVFTPHVYNVSGTVTASAATSGPGGSDSATYVVTVVDAPAPPADIVRDPPPAPDQPASTSFADAATFDFNFLSATTGVTVARTGSAWDDSPGTITAYANGVARRNNTYGLLIEGASTNELLNNSNLSTWTLTGASVATGQADPLTAAGTAACKLTEDTSLGEHSALMPAITFTNGGSDRLNHLEFYVKGSSRGVGYARLTVAGDPTQFIQATFTLSGSGTLELSRSTGAAQLITPPPFDVLAGSIVAMSNSCYRVRLTGIVSEAANGNGLQVLFGIMDSTGAKNYQGNGTAGLIVYGFRVEAGYDRCTSTLATVAGTAITRNAESVTFSPSTTLDTAAGTYGFSLPRGGRPFGQLLDTTNGGLAGDGIAIGYDAEGNLFCRFKDHYATSAVRDSYNGQDPDALYLGYIADGNDTKLASEYLGILVSYDATGIDMYGWDGTYIRPLGTLAVNPGTPTAGASASLGHTIGGTHHLDNFIAKFKSYNVKITAANALWWFEQNGV